MYMVLMLLILELPYYLYLFNIGDPFVSFYTI